MKTARFHHVKRMLPLYGAIVEQVIVDGQGDDDIYCGFILKKKDGTTVQVIAMMDPEGNGPGHLTITELK